LIRIYLENDSFEHDVRSLTKAFFKKEEQVVTYMPYEEAKNVTSDEDIILAVFNDKEDIKMQLRDPSGVLHTEEFHITEKKDRRLYKNDFKKVLYKVCVKATGTELPWGTLTGIRPTKVPFDFLENGEGEEAARRFMEDEYLCGKEKTDLSLEVAKRELKLLSAIDYKEGYSIYIGIPFCPSICLYCSFSSYAIGAYKNYVDKYVDALCKEIEWAGTAIKDKVLKTIYIGGGTPSSLSAEHLEILLKKINETFNVKDLLEFSVEAGRPDSITMEKLVVLKKYGVTRISINPQTMNESTLKLIGRAHTPEQVKEAYAMARQAGHDNINLDLIIGLPGENADSVAYTLREIEPLNPESLTVHALAIKRAANLKEQLDKMYALMPTDAAKMQQLTSEYAAAHGYDPYYLYRQKNITDNLENIGYAKEGKECLYNILIMEEKHTILALGAGAACKFVGADGSVTRTENVKSVKDYIERVSEMIERKEAVIRSGY
jgi:oxygen-independent coproporphyrinogen-3 oxidase